MASLLRQKNWGSAIEVERRNRIMVCLAALAYEEFSSPIMSDGAFDALALAIKPKRATGHAELDAWFRENFSPHTGSWIGLHPHKRRLRALLQQHYNVGN